VKRAFLDPWFWGQVAWLFAVGAGAPALAHRLGGSAAGAWLPVAGMALLVLGFWVFLAGVRDLGPNLTPATRPRRDGELVTHGLYAHVRHPIYLGLILACTGWAAAWGNLLVTVMAGAGTALYLGAKASVEERKLLAQFPAYAEYRARVPMLFPGRTRADGSPR